MNKKTQTKLSKFLSLVLRHQPQTIGITLSEQGWVDTQTLIEKMNEYGKPINMDTLSMIVETNAKKRFAFNADQSRIRANQGHSVDIDLGYVQKTPPNILYHGTAQQNIDSIFKIGVDKRNRHHVHLSQEIDTAYKVGQRHGKPIILHVLAKEMHGVGFKFYESDNKVWLTDHVPVEYIRRNEENG